MFEFFVIATKQLCRLTLFRKPVRYLGKMFSKNEETGLYSPLWNILDRLGRTLICWYLLFLYRESFSYTGVMPASFRIDGKIGKLIGLFIYLNLKGEKKSTFCFKSLIGVSDEWDALFVSNLFFSFARLVFILRCFWYLDIVIETWSPFPGVKVYCLQL